MFAIGGFLLRDSSRLGRLSETPYAFLPPAPASTVRDILAQSEQRAGVAGLVSVLLLVFNGSNAFASTERVFNLAYGVRPRNVIVQRLLGLIMLLVVSMLLFASTVAYRTSRTSEKHPRT